jgi:hypothetical protein
MGKMIDSFMERRLQQEEAKKAKVKNSSENKDVFQKSSPENSTEPFMTEILKVLDKFGDKNSEDPRKSFIEEALKSLDKNGENLFTKMMAIESLHSSPSTDATQDKIVADYTREELLKWIINSSSLEWNKNPAFYKAVARKYKALIRAEIE